MMLPTRDGHALETIMNLLLLRFGIIAAVVVVIVIALFALALWLRRRGTLGKASRRAAPLARTAAAYRSRSRRGRSDLISAGLSTLATALERTDDKNDAR
ncbi:hypothetical protein [Paramicrobacterium chengjingii]|uniref:Uncharacterized protein n=1 Tax=Paramicrobacterium chengjingii TaxID=2769067 RepID=A0ABX6YIS3_9MICO|nr:hypothetical protein [Microbacterium chengjingii]QPZ38726.1 hypothetical protein HCR76_01040 [Microbacterium chengjingii]